VIDDAYDVSMLAEVEVIALTRQIFDGTIQLQRSISARSAAAAAGSPGAGPIADASTGGSTTSVQAGDRTMLV
jgi:hypothetical protein